MSVLKKLSTSLNRKDQVPNQELAKNIAATNDKKAVKELVENLNNKSRALQGDCIKTLYELGEIKPSLIAEYANEFIAQLDSKNNRMQWGAMTAIDYITESNTGLIYKALPKIISVAEKGSVITRDHFVNILIKLCAGKKHYDEAMPLLIEQIMSCPTNQLPKYAEDSLAVLEEKSKKHFLKALTSRLGDIDSETKRKRVDKVIKKLS